MKMDHRRSILIGSVSVIAVAISAPALADGAQEAVATVSAQGAQGASSASGSTTVQEVVVTGIKASLEKAIRIKKNSDDMVDAISSEDIGKLPDRNVADALQRLPGVNTQSAASGEGGFDENDRVTVRGTPSSLTQVTIDGHAVATGDWFVLDQTTAVGRSVSMALLPSQIVDNLIVDKSQNASLTEGGTAASIDIQTRKPLDLTKPITVEASFEGAYNTLTGTTKPQINALLGWKSDDGTFGIIAQGFYEERDVRRYGQETLGWSALTGPNCGTTTVGGQALNNPAPTISNNQFSCALGTLQGGNPITYNNANTVGAAYPTLIGSTLFEQQRKREGGDLSAQWRPNDQFEVRLDGFYSDLNATNFNDNFMFDGSREFANGAPTSFTMANNTITSAVFPSNPTGNNIAAVEDNIIRPNAESQTYYVNLDAKLKVNDKLTFKGQIGFTHGLGNTPQQPLFEVDNVTSPASYGLSGNGMAVSFPGLNTQSASGLNVDWAQNFVDHAIDTEAYAKVDGDYVVDDGLWKDVSFGVRFGDHKRQVDAWDRGCTLTTPAGTTYGQAGATVNCNGDYSWSGAPVPYSAVNPTTYPSGFNAGALGIPNLLIPTAGNPNAIVSLIDSIPDALRGSVAHTVQPINYYYPWSFKVQENDFAGYVMARVGGDRWRANFGVRLVETQENAYVNVPGNAPAGGTTITTSAFGNYYVDHVEHDYFDILPSLNVTFDLKPDLLLRFNAAEAMSRPDYSALGGAVSLTDTNLTGNGGNPNLKPIKSANFNTSLEWYYAKQSALTFDVFYMDLSSYVTYGVTTETYFCQSCGVAPAPGQPNPGAFEPFNISAPYNISGQIRGFELAWQQPIAYGFGVLANFTYADGEDADGHALVGDSRDTGNITAYYEKGRFSARLAYTYRSHYFVGLDRSSAENMDNSDSLDASANVKLTNNVSLSFQGLNLTNSLLKYYAANRSQPRAVYENGTQMYFGLHFKY
jgi:iron complex outermembrane receptor protein